MKNICLLLLAVAVLTGFTQSAGAQARLSLTTTSVSNSTPPLGSQISILTSLTNVSTVDTFNGIVNFSLANKDSIITNLSIVGYPNFAGTFITLAPQQQRAALFTVQLLTSYFAVGPDIIIVWPKAANAMVLDSAAAPLNITWATGTNDLAPDNISLYTANDNLIIKNSNPKSGLEQLQIFDLTGKLLMGRTLSDNLTIVSLDNLSSGMYIAVVTNAVGQMKAVKLVR